MNCAECREELAAYLEGLADETPRGQVEAHLAECSSCRMEVQSIRELMVHLTQDGLGTPLVSLENAVMDRIIREQAIELRRLNMRKRIRVLGISGAVAAAAAMLLISGLWITQPAAAEAEKAAKVLARGAEAVPKASTVHIVAKMRTLAHDNFSLILADLPFVPVEVWKQLGEKPKWRVEKPGRVAVMDGDSTVMLIREHLAIKVPHATEAPFDTGWILGLAKVQDMLTNELRDALAKGWDLKLTHETTPAGEKELLVTVEAKAEMPENFEGGPQRFADIKNKFFEISDMRRVYRFHAGTQRLVGFDAYLHRPGADVLVVAVQRIEYDQPIDPALFALALPKDIEVQILPERLPDNKKYEEMTPQQAAQAFLEACAKGDWGRVQKFATRSLDEPFKKAFGGLEIVSFGETFQSKVYGCWLIPYAIKLKDGTIRKGNLPMRRDGWAKRLVLCDFWPTEPAHPAAAEKAAELMTRSAEAAPKASTVHVLAKMRTFPADNFGGIDAGSEPVNVEIWYQYGDKPRWRVEKPGRVIVMNGASTVMLIRPMDVVVPLPFPTEGSFDSWPLLRLAKAREMITRELQEVRAKGWDLELADETTPTRPKRLTVAVEAKAGVPKNDPIRNKFFDCSDMRRVYRFDTQTQRFEGFDAYLHQPGGDVVVLTTERIEYGQPIDPQVFTLKVPEKTQRYREAEHLPDNKKYEKLSPEEAARAFFEACAKQDWNEAQKFYPLTLGEDVKKGLGGLQIIHLGERFKESKAVGGWLVPFEVRLKDGKFLAANAAMRNDNPANRYVLVNPLMLELAMARLPNNDKYEKLSPGEAARAFFEACAKQDWNEAQKFCRKPLEDQFKKHFGGLQLLSLGKPFQQLEKYHGWYIPYVIKLKDGTVKKFNLAMYKDDSAKRYLWDGGL